MTEYTATTSNSTNKVTATATDSEAEIEIKIGSTTIINGSNASWQEGENELTITVSEYGNSTTYTVVVTAS